jgi:hypothetical protein
LRAVLSEPHVAPQRCLPSCPPWSSPRSRPCRTPTEHSKHRGTRAPLVRRSCKPPWSWLAPRLGAGSRKSQPASGRHMRRSGAVVCSHAAPEPPRLPG